MLCTSLLGFFISLLASTVLAEDYRQTVYPEISPANTCAKWKTACKELVRLIPLGSKSGHSHLETALSGTTSKRRMDSLKFARWI